MGPQDGVDYVLRAADEIVHKLGRDDISFTLMGSGDCFDELVALRDELGLGDYVELHRPRPRRRRARACSRPPTSGSRRIPRTRSTTSRR